MQKKKKVGCLPASSFSLIDFSSSTDWVTGLPTFTTVTLPLGLYSWSSLLPSEHPHRKKKKNTHTGCQNYHFQPKPHWPPRVPILVNHFPNMFIRSYFYFICTCVCWCVYVCICGEVRGQREGLFFPSITRVLGIEFRSSCGRHLYHLSHLSGPPKHR